MTKHKDIQTLEDSGITVEQFSPHHFRVEGKIDIWPGKKKYWITGSEEKSGIYSNITEIADVLKEEEKEFDSVKTLRDEFAMVAMQGLMAAWGNHDVTNYEEIASDAYSMADKMMEARKHGK